MSNPTLSPTKAVIVGLGIAIYFNLSRLVGILAREYTPPLTQQVSSWFGQPNGHPSILSQSNGTTCTLVLTPTHFTRR